MPRSDELPDELSSLSRRHAVRCNTEVIDLTMKRLLAALRRTFESRLDAEVAISAEFDSALEMGREPNKPASTSTYRFSYQHA